MTTVEQNIPKEEILLQLKRITTSPKFNASTRLSRFLKFVVDETLAGNGANIKAYTVALEVFDKDAGFDPQKDPIVRIYAGRLREALTAYYLLAGKDDPIVIRIPKGSYQPVFERLQSPRSIRRPKSRKSTLMIASAIALILLASYFLIPGDRGSIEIPEDEYGRTAFSVLPFENIDQSVQDVYFIETVKDNLETALSQFSVVLYTTPDENMFNDHYLMSGTVQQEGAMVKVNVKLTDSHNGQLVFSKEYQESLLSNSADYIDEIVANSIAIDLADEFGEFQNYELRTAQSEQDQLSPHQAVLAYYSYLTHMNKEENVRLIQQLSQTVKDYDSYAPLWAAISGLYMDSYKHFEGPAQHLQLAKDAVARSERINPHNWHVQNHLAQIALLEGNKENFYDAIERQMELNSNSTMVGQVGLWLCLIEEFETGIPLIEEAMAKNQYYPRFLHFGLALHALEQGDVEGALEESRKVRMPELYWDPLFRAALLGKLGREQEATEALNELLELRPNFSRNGTEAMALALYSEKYRTFLLEGLQTAGLVIN